jgi:hypothetical protein
MLESHPLKALFACNQCGVYNASKKLLSNHKKVYNVGTSTESKQLFDLQKIRDISFQVIGIG